MVKILPSDQFLITDGQIKRIKAGIIRQSDNFKELCEITEHLINELEKTTNEIEAKDARIAELEGRLDDVMGNCNSLRERCWKLEEQVKRLEPAFLKAKTEERFLKLTERGFLSIDDAYSQAKNEATEALEKIKNGQIR